MISVKVTASDDGGSLLDQRNFIPDATTLTEFSVAQGDVEVRVTFDPPLRLVQEVSDARAQ